MFQIMINGWATLSHGKPRLDDLRSRIRAHASVVHGLYSLPQSGGFEEV
jgi:hypothetical protein